MRAGAGVGVATGVFSLQECTFRACPPRSVGRSDDDSPFLRAQRVVAFKAQRPCARHDVPTSQFEEITTIGTVVVVSWRWRSQSCCSHSHCGALGHNERARRRSWTTLGRRRSGVGSVAAEAVETTQASIATEFDEIASVAEVLWRRRRDCRFPSVSSSQSC